MVVKWLFQRSSMDEPCTCLGENKGCGLDVEVWGWFSSVLYSIWC